MAKKKIDFTARLKKMNRVWKQAEESSGTGINEHIEDGNHEAQLVSAELVDVSGGKVMVAWKWKFADVDKKILKKDKLAAFITSRDGLDTAQNMSFLKRRLSTFGYKSTEMDLANDLEDTLAELTKKKPTCKVKVKTSDDGQWQNVWPNKVTDEGEEVEDEEEEEVEDEEEEEVEDEEEEEEGDAAEIEKDSEVLFTPPNGKKQLTCTVTRANKDGTFNLESETGKKFAKIDADELELADGGEEDEEEEEEEDSDEEFGDLEAGSKVEVDIDGKSYKATVVSVNEKKETVKVKVSTPGKLKGQTKTVSTDAVELLDD